MKNSEHFKIFDIERLAELYQNKSLEELISNCRILRNEMGNLLEIVEEPDEFPRNLDLRMSKIRLVENLKIVDTIGENTERELKKKGIKNVYDLKPSLRYSGASREIVDLIDKKDYQTLYQSKNIHDIDLLFCFPLEKLLFLDIETMSLRCEPMVLVGIGYYAGNVFHVRQFFARELDEEVSICEHLRTAIFPYFNCFVTYNGKSFDIPYLASRFLYFFNKNPMISESDVSFQGCNSRFHHVDLYHNCRRMYQDLCESFSLRNIELKLLNWRRSNDLPGEFIGECYQKYLKNPKKYAGLMKELVAHNFRDICSMPFILEKLLQSRV